MAVQGKKATEQFSTTSVSSEEDLNVYCQPCDRDGPRLPAHGYCTNCSEHLCETCFTVHRRHTLSRHHTLQDKTSMPQTLSPRQPDNFTKPCPKHNMEMIKYYCHDHKDLICSVCITNEHTAAYCAVNYIPDISGQIINSKVSKDILNDINDMTDTYSKTLQEMKKKNDESNQSLTDALVDIIEFRTDINKRLDEMERQVNEAARVIQKNNSKNLMKVETICGDVTKSLKSTSDAIKHLNKSKQANELFLEVRHAEQMIKDYEQNIGKLSEFDTKIYKFQPNEAISNLLDKEMSLGKMKGKTLNPGLKSRQSSNMDKICIGTRKENYTCAITGMTLLAPDLLIFIDNYNNAIKMVDVTSNSVVVQHCFGSDLSGSTSLSGPWDVTSVSQNELAVTFPSDENIQIMYASKRSFIEKNILKVDGKCCGISCHEDKMVVSFTRPCKVQILLINGTVLQTNQDEDIFINPAYITTSASCIYVSDSQMNAVIQLNWQCEVKGIYTCADNPRGLTMSDDDTVFVCCDNNTIKEISGDCTKELVVVQNIKSPQTVYWSAETCTLYASTWFVNIDSLRQDDNCIKTFKLSK